MVIVDLFVQSINKSRIDSYQIERHQRPRSRQQRVARGRIVLAPHSVIAPPDGMRFDPLLEGCERLGPEAIEVLAQGINGLRIDCVHTAGSGRSIRHKAGAFEDTEMLRNRRPADGEFASELADGQRAFEEAREDRAAGRVPKGIELGVLVSTHLR